MHDEREIVVLFVLDGVRHDLRKIPLMILDRYQIFSLLNIYLWGLLLLLTLRGGFNLSLFNLFTLFLKPFLVYTHMTRSMAFIKRHFFVFVIFAQVEHVHVVRFLFIP